MRRALLLAGLALVLVSGGILAFTSPPRLLSVYDRVAGGGAGARQVAEGVRTTRSAYELSRREGVEMPIVEAMYRVLYEDLPPLEAVVALMTRRLRAERD
jgi:hypothetical protein